MYLWYPIDFIKYAFQYINKQIFFVWKDYFCFKTNILKVTYLKLQKWRLGKLIFRVYPHTINNYLFNIVHM